MYVDPIFTAIPRTTQAKRAGRRWCHLLVGYRSDLEDLHRMALKIGLQRQWFQESPWHPHYDLTPSKRKLAIANGAVEVDQRTALKLCSRMPCTYCPTALGKKIGYDPEARDSLLCPEWVEEEISNDSKFWCPWKKRWCVAYPEALAKAREAHQAGLVPDVKPAEKYTENS